MHGQTSKKDVNQLLVGAAAGLALGALASQILSDEKKRKNLTNAFNDLNDKAQQVMNELKNLAKNAGQEIKDEEIIETKHLKSKTDEETKE